VEGLFVTTGSAVFDVFGASLTFQPRDDVIDRSIPPFFGVYRWLSRSALVDSRKLISQALN